MFKPIPTGAGRKISQSQPPTHALVSNQKKNRELPEAGRVGTVSAARRLKMGCDGGDEMKSENHTEEVLDDESESQQA